MESAATIDDLAAATVGIAFADDAPPASTGFLLAEPRVIVTDGYVLAAPGVDPERITLVTSSGRRLTTRASRICEGHPFSPWVLEAPAGLNARGLRVSAEPLKKGEALQFAVAAGERTGLAPGTVLSGRAAAIDVSTLGRVPDLVHVRAFLAPGSSGAPAVDGDLAVRGFVAAGSDEEARPDTYVYPAGRWLAAVLDSSGGA